MTGPDGREWTDEALKTTPVGSQRHASDRMGDRVASQASTDCSPGRRAAAWHTYIVSLLPHPAHVAVPTPDREQVLMAQFRRAMRLARAK